MFHDVSYLQFFDAVKFHFLPPLGAFWSAGTQAACRPSTCTYSRASRMVAGQHPLSQPQPPNYPIRPTIKFSKKYGNKIEQAKCSTLILVLGCFHDFVVSLLSLFCSPKNCNGLAVQGVNAMQFLQRAKNIGKVVISGWASSCDDSWGTPEGAG